MDNNKECPHCGSVDLGDYWTKYRKLKCHCRKCGWEDSPRIPEKQEIKNIKLINVSQFGGFHYVIFDKYGHTMEYSSHYTSEEEAIKNLILDMKRSNQDENCKPLWPAVVEVCGKVFTEV